MKRQTLQYVQTPAFAAKAAEMRHFRPQTMQHSLALLPTTEVRSRLVAVCYLFVMSGIAQEIRRYSEVRLRRFESTEFGGSRETILALYPNGQFEYVEIEQYEGSGSSRHPGSGTWDAEGDLPSGALILRWSHGEVTKHSFNYAGGETCQVDGQPAYISAN